MRSCALLAFVLSVACAASALQPPDRTIPQAAVKVGGPKAAAQVPADTESTQAQSREAGKAIGCLSNVRKLCLGLLTLAMDNHEVFKCRADSWKKAIMPYVRRERCFHCPADRSGAVSYSINPYVVGKKSTKIQFPAETVLVYEGRKMKLDFRHTGRAAVGFVDSHSQLITRQQAKKLRWKPQVQRRRPATSHAKRPS